MNKLSLDEAREQIGPHAWQKLESLKNFLKFDSPFSSARYAPSIVVRSETEFLSFSAPRFAIRLYFDSQCNTFINCRRLQWISDKSPIISNANPRRAPDDQRNPLIIELITPLEPANFATTRTCIADGLVPTPKRLPAFFNKIPVNIGQTNFSIVKSDLGKAFGETNALPNNLGDVIVNPITESDFSGTPYVKTVDISGGLCAQASCFVATAILHNYSRGLFGLAEITALVNPSSCKELAISGLTEQEMCLYFDRVGLHAIQQFVRPASGYLKLTEDYEKSLRAYLRSNFPVILMVDSSKLKFISQDSTSIYSANNWSIRLSVADVPQKHSIVLVGCATQDSTYLFHDCSAMPFMAATMEQLKQVGHFIGEPSNKIAPPPALPVTPGSVLVPLLNWIEPGGSISQTEVGLFNLSLALDDLCALNDEYSEFLTHCRPEGEYFLTQLDGLANLPDWLLAVIDSEERRVEFGTQLNLVKQRLMNEMGWIANHWLWVEVRTSAIRLWNAELKLPTRKNPELFQQMLKEYLPVTVKVENMSVKACYHTAVPKLEVGLISSYCVHGIASAMKSWPTSLVTSLELYTFMQSDLPTLFPNDPSFWQTKTAVQALAEAWRKYSSEGESFITPVANSILKLTEGKRIRAFASFVPEILASSNSTLWRTGQEALLFLVELARLVAPDNVPFTIEVVSGSIIESVWNARMRDSDTGLGATLLAPDQALTLLLSRLAPIAERAMERGKTRVQIAIELEPGPLFNLNTGTMLRKLCEELEYHSLPYVKAAIGVNLDIAHWAFLAGIHPQWLLLPENRCILNRIIHCHISDHCRGHLCDGFIGAFHSEEDFLVWIRLLANLARSRMPGEGPQFSGLISLEHEGCRDANLISSSIKRLKHLVKLALNAPV